MSLIEKSKDKLELQQYYILSLYNIVQKSQASTLA